MFACIYLGNVGIAFAFIFAVLAMTYVIGSLSGCHINPAVVISTQSVRKIDAKDAAIYIVAQCTGAVFGASIFCSTAVGNPACSLVINGLGQNGCGAASPSGF